MPWSGLGSLGRLVQPLLPHFAPGVPPAAASHRAPDTPLIQPLHVQRAHARAHPLHAARRNRANTDMLTEIRSNLTI
jgi:hypothetical protein